MSLPRLLRVCGPFHELQPGEVTISAPGLPYGADVDGIYIDLPPELTKELPRKYCDVSIAARDSQFNLTVSVRRKHTEDSRPPMTLFTVGRRGLRQVISVPELTFLACDKESFLVVPEDAMLSPEDIKALYTSSEKIAMGAIARQLKAYHELTTPTLQAGNI